MDGMSFSDHGKLYFGGLTRNALFEWDPATPLVSARPLASSSVDMQWPDTFAWDGQGGILFTTNKLQRYFTNTIDTREGIANYRIVRVHVGRGIGSYINGPLSMRGARVDSCSDVGDDQAKCDAMSGCVFCSGGWAHTHGCYTADAASRLPPGMFSCQ